MSFFGGGFTHDKGVDPYLKRLGDEEYGDYTPMAGQNQVNRQFRGLLRGGNPLTSTGLGMSILANNNNQYINQRNQRQQNINTGGFGTMGGTYNARLMDQGDRQGQSDLRADNMKAGEGVFNTYAQLAGQGADRKNLYTDNNARFRAGQDEALIKGYQGSTQYHQGIGGQLLQGALGVGMGAATGGLSSAFSGGFGGGYRNNSSFDYNGAPHFS